MASKIHKRPCCPFEGGGSIVVVDSMFYVPPIVCRNSMFGF